MEATLNNRAHEINEWYRINVNKINELDNIAYKYGISFSQYSLLNVLIETDCSNPSSISKKLNISRASVSRTLKILQKKYLIQKSYGDESDQRKTKIEITNRGIDVVNEIKKSISDPRVGIFN